jgi:hypothetical protein
VALTAHCHLSGVALRNANGLDDVRLGAGSDDSDGETMNDSAEIFGGCLPRTIVGEHDRIRFAKFSEQSLPR